MSDLKVEARVLRDMLQYQEGAIVSRVLVKNPGGNVTLFAFDQGQELSEHTAPFDAVVVLLDGQAEIRVDGTPYTLKDGDTLTMPAHRPHALKAVAAFKMLLIMLKAAGEE